MHDVVVVVAAVAVIGNLTTKHVAVLSITPDSLEMSTCLPRQDIVI